MPSELPFEYTSRWPEIKDMIQSGQIDDAKQALEDRDRKLEEFLKTLGSGGTVGQSIFSITQNVSEFSLASGGATTTASVAFTLPATVPGFNFYVDVWTHALVSSQSMSGDCDPRLSCNFYVTEFAPGTGFENYGWNERDHAIQGDGFIWTVSGRRTFDLTTDQTGADQTCHVLFTWANNSIATNLPSVEFATQSSVQVYATPS